MSAIRTDRVSFDSVEGHKLSGRLDRPLGPIQAYALFAHCFTCSKDFNATNRITRALAGHGIATLRFDFTGLGHSHGEFSEGGFSSNVADILQAAAFMREAYRAPQLLIGHSLGGAAVLATANHIPEIKAVATIAAPSDAEHVTGQFSHRLEEILSQGAAEVDLGGRPFTISKQFVEDLKSHDVLEQAARIKPALMVMHAPHDSVVGIDNASRIFTAAKHPKSFVSLDDADHLLSKEEDARFVASVLAGWAGKYIRDQRAPDDDEMDVQVTEMGTGKFVHLAEAGRHSFLMDEPKSYGGDDAGITPYQAVSLGLAACTSMTLRMYVRRKKWDIGNISVDVAYEKIHAKDCEDCGDHQDDVRLDLFNRTIEIEGPITDTQKTKLLEIAEKCPVHRTLEASSVVKTQLA